MRRSHLRLPFLRTSFAVALLALSFACQTPTSNSSVATTSAPKPAAHAPATPAGRILDLADHANQVEDHLRYLTGKIGPRLTSSHNLQHAEEWARDQFASWGLDARLESWGDFAVGFDRGPSSVAIVAPEKTSLVFTTMAWTAGTNGAVRGKAVLYPKNDAELAALDGKLAGAWVVVPSFAAAERPNGEMRKKIDAALADAKIAGKLRRAFGRKGELVITDGNHDIKWDKLPTSVDISVRGDQLDHLIELLAKPEPVELECNIDNRFYQGPVTQYNVIADLKGSEKPDEIVVVGGHIDSWDGAQGAQDNGTGVCTTLEAARLLVKSGAKPKRTIRFMLWSGEEQGLYGSKGYVKTHEAELGQISAVLVHDGGTNYLSGIRCTPEMEADLRAVFAPIMAWHTDMPFEIAVGEGIPNSGDSDHASFISKGVPGFFWNQTGTADYDFVHHTQNDVFENANQTYQRHSAGVVAVGALGLANLDHLLSRENMKAVDPRRMNVQLDGTKVTSVFEDGVAAKAGWKEGDVILAIDGVAMTTRDGISAELQKGEPIKTVTLQRGADKIETKLDWSDTPSEKERVERAKKRAESAAKKP